MRINLPRPLVAQNNYLPMNNRSLFLVGLYGLLPITVLSTQTVLSQTQILEVASDDLIAPIGGMVTWYTFSVPEEAVNPRLIGH